MFVLISWGSVIYLLNSSKVASEVNELNKTKEKEFNDYKAELKKYFSISKIILDDVQAITQTMNEGNALTTKDYTKNKLVVDKLKSQINVMRSHIQQYKDIVNKDQTILAELGVDTQGDLKKIDEGLLVYDKGLAQVKTYVETLK